MAVKTLTVSDLSEEEGAEQHTFALDKREGEIDLTEKEYEELQEFLETYFDKGRVTKGRRSANGNAAVAAAASAHPSRDLSQEDRAELREWMPANGHGDYPANGKVAKRVLEAWRASKGDKG